MRKISEKTACDGIVESIHVVGKESLADSCLDGSACSLSYSLSLWGVILRRCCLVVEIAGIPVATLSGSLRSEMHPDAELCLAQPCRCARIVLFYAFPRRLNIILRSFFTIWFVTQRASASPTLGKVFKAFVDLLQE